MKKILITYASYGSGHKTIANYIKDYIYDEDKYEIKIIDIIDDTGKIVDMSIKAFDYVYNHRMELLFSFCYKSLDNKIIMSLYDIYFKHFIFNNKLKNIYCDFNPDIVISTHSYGSNVAAYLKKQNLINPQIITLVTDYKVHRFWMTSHDKDEIFIVANEIVKNNMIKKGCYTNHIYAYGLPYNEKLRINLLSKELIYKKYNLDSNKKTILFFGGGSSGSEAYLKYLKTLSHVNLNDYQILFVCGKNEKLKNKAEIYSLKYNNIKIFGFINNVYELLDIADIVITKPGGATVTEGLEMCNFMLLIPGIGGQEEYNAKYVVKIKHGVYRKSRLSFLIYLLFKVKNGKYIYDYDKNKINNESLEHIKELINKL